jgi:hypothetical protein
VPRLPTLKKDLSDKLRRVHLELDALPKSFEDNPQAHLLSLCGTFIQEIDDYTNGKPSHNPDQPTFLQDALMHYRIFRQQVNHTRPRFVVPPANTCAAPSLSALEVFRTSCLIPRAQMMEFETSMASAQQLQRPPSSMGSLVQSSEESCDTPTSTTGNQHFIAGY